MKKIVNYSFILAFILLLMPLFFVKAEAKELFDADFFNSANTFNLGVEKKSDYYKFSFDKNNKNNNKVEDKTKITFLTHGLSGTAADYSRNSNGFGYNEYSLITAIDRKEDSNIYVVNFYSEFSFKILKIVNKLTYETEEITNILDFSKHSIVLYSGYNTQGGNDYIYSQFNIMTSYILNDYKEVNNGFLPKINLVGFSRGGLTNIQYTLDHPDLVDSLYSLDSPYFSTSVADMDYNFKDIDPVVENDGIYDIQDEEQYLSYYNRWNNNYELYKNINANAIGMYQPLALMFYQLTYKFFYGFIENNQRLFAQIGYTFLEGFSSLFNMSFNMLEAIRALSRNFEGEGKVALYKFLDELVNEKGEIILYFDGLVDLDSQLARDDKNGYSYKGFNRFTYKLSFARDYYYRASSRDSMVATHAIAPYVEAAQEYILNSIELQ